MTATSDALQISTSKFFNIWLLKWHQDPWVWCNQHQLQRSGQTPLDHARRKGHDEVVKILENAEFWLHKCVNESRSFVSESDCFQQDTATAADFVCAFALNLPEAWSSKICAWSNSAVGAISGLMVRPSCFTRPWSNRYENANIWGRTNRLLFCEVQNWRNMFLISALFLLRYVSTTETTLYQRTFWSFLPTILFASSVWSHHAASWYILVQASKDWNQASVAMCRWRTCQLASPFDRDKLTGLSASMLELLRSPLIWIGQLVLPIEHEPPAAAWLREWLQLFRLETRLPWPTHAESLTIVELGNEVFYCA